MRFWPLTGPESFNCIAQGVCRALVCQVAFDDAPRHRKSAPAHARLLYQSLCPRAHPQSSSKSRNPAGSSSAFPSATAGYGHFGTCGSVLSPDQCPQKLVLAGSPRTTATRQQNSPARPVQLDGLQRAVEPARKFPVWNLAQQFFFFRAPRPRLPIESRYFQFRSAHGHTDDRPVQLFGQRFIAHRPLQQFVPRLMRCTIFISSFAGELGFSPA